MPRRQVLSVRQQTAARARSAESSRATELGSSRYTFLKVKADAATPLERGRTIACKRGSDISANERVRCHVELEAGGYERPSGVRDAVDCRYRRKAHIRIHSREPDGF